MSVGTQLNPSRAAADSSARPESSARRSGLSPAGSPSMRPDARRRDLSFRVQLVLKRVLDITVAVVGLIVLSPLMLVLAILVRRDIGRPILFRQLRPGKDEVNFTILKFRTMQDAVDADGVELPDGDRLTPLGRRLRRTSLDELPQLWSVLRGDLSLVGPRPLLIEWIPLYSPRQSTRHHVPPGITGWAQIHGRNSLSWEEKFSLDADYVEAWSLWLDLRILARTAIIVFRRHGISSPGHATMPRFTGSPPGTP